MIINDISTFNQNAFVLIGCNQDSSAGDELWIPGNDRCLEKQRNPCFSRISMFMHYCSSHACMIFLLKMTSFLKTGQFSDVHAVVKQLRTKKVKDEDAEKPVTKLMLKEIYKWDEC